MEKGTKIRVLWVDDEYENLIDRYQDSAACPYNIELNAFSTAEEGLRELKENPIKWDAVILDVKGFKSDVGEVARSIGFSYFKDELLRMENEHFIPWFVFSGQPDKLDDDEFADSLWNRGYSSKPVYSKHSDMQLLWTDIEKFVRESEDWKIRNKYSNVFVDDLSDYDSRYLFDVLKSYDRGDSFDKRISGEMRDVVQDLLEQCVMLKIINDDSDKLCGRSKKLSERDDVSIVVQESVRMLTRLLNVFSHPNRETQELVSGKYPYVFPVLMNALLTFVLWFVGDRKKLNEI